MATQVGSGDELIIYLPNRGQTNWSEDFRTQFAELIAKHDHTGAGKGVKITGSAIAEGTIQDSNLAFVDLTPTPQTGYVLQWNGSNFVPGAVSASGGISGISAQAESTIMALTDSAITLTTNAGSPANTPGNELDLRINGGKVLVDGSNNSNLLLSSSVGASAADPNTKLYIKLAARSTAFDATDKTTWSDIVISNPTDSGNAAVGMRFTVDDADDTNEGAGIAGVKTSATEPDMDLRFITHPTASSTSRESMKLSDSFDGNSLGHTTTLTVNDDSQTSNITKLGLGTDTPTSTIDVKTSEDAIIKLHNTSESGNDDLSSIQFKNTHATEGDKDWGSVGFTRTDNSALIIETKSDNTDGGINLKTNGTGSNANISLDAHASILMVTDNNYHVNTRGDVEIKAGDHDNAEGEGVNNDAHLLLKAGQPSYTGAPADGCIMLSASDDVILAADDDVVIMTNSTEQLNIRENGDLEYKGDFSAARDAYFVRAYATVHYDANTLLTIVADGFDSFSKQSNGITANLISSYPDQEVSYTTGSAGTIDHTLTNVSNGGHYTVAFSYAQNMSGTGDWSDNDSVNNYGSAAVHTRRRNSFKFKVVNTSGNSLSNCGLVDFIVIRR